MALLACEADAYIHGAGRRHMLWPIAGDPPSGPVRSTIRLINTLPFGDVICCDTPTPRIVPTTDAIKTWVVRGA